MHYGNPAEIEQHGRNACRFCKWVSNAFAPEPTEVNLPWVLIIIRIPVCRSSRVIVIRELTRGVPSERYYWRNGVC